MGCSRCSECGGKFEASSAEEYAEGIGRDPDYETCPRCLEKSDQEAAKENEFASLEAEVLRLRSENAQLRATTVKRPAPAVIDLTKRQKVSAPSSIWVIGPTTRTHSSWILRCWERTRAARRPKPRSRNTSRTADGNKDMAITRVRAKARLRSSNPRLTRRRNKLARRLQHVRPSQSTENVCT